MSSHCLWGSVFVFVLVLITLCPFLCCKYLDDEERSGCFALLSVVCLVTVKVMWLFLKVP